MFVKCLYKNEVEKGICPFCKTSMNVFIQYMRNDVFLRCPICGCVNLGDEFETSINYNHLVAYLVYNQQTDLIYNDDNQKIYSLGSLDEIIRTNPHAITLNKKIIDGWYPTSISEKIDSIMLYFGKCCKHIGQELQLEADKMEIVLFIDRLEIDKDNSSANYIRWRLRNGDILRDEREYMLSCLRSQRLIEFTCKGNSYGIRITYDGYTRIDKLEKNLNNGKNAFVAMSFNKTDGKREKIREGIENTGYRAIFIDEIEHNELITPEIIKQIKGCRFLVFDLSDSNLGAYYEAGFAHGIGKPVIQICQRDKIKDMHFDVKQINTIFFDTIDEIVEKLSKRITASIY